MFATAVAMTEWSVIAKHIIGKQGDRGWPDTESDQVGYENKDAGHLAAHAVWRDFH